MKHNLFISTILSGTLLVGVYGQMALAADVEIQDAISNAAVSAPNGKIELGGGWSDIDVIGSDEELYGAASISLPVGESFGFQGDLNVGRSFGETGFGGAGHLFTRDPNSYLFGAIGGYSDLGPASALFGGAEAEFYLNNVSVELAGGIMNIDPDTGGSVNRMFAMADLGLYATDNLRLSIGARSVAKFESANIGAEWMFDGMPLSLKANGSVGEDGYKAATVGLSFYFGGNDSNKSLIRRHREDDPRNRALDIFGSGAAGAIAAAAGTLGAGPLVCGEFEFPYDSNGDNVYDTCLEFG
jgi:hypothetical protein